MWPFLVASTHPIVADDEDHDEDLFVVEATGQ